MAIELSVLLGREIHDQWIWTSQMDIESSSLLLSERLAPITTSMGFLGTDLAFAAQEFETWHNEIGAQRNVCASGRQVSGSLGEVLRALLPLRISDSNRYLFIPTASKWTAYFDNGSRGTDPSAIGYLARRLKCRTIWIVANPHTLQKTGVPRRGRQGALLLELHGPEDTDWLNLVREIRLHNDAGRWEFTQHGTPLPFEDIAQYSAMRIRDRFPFDLFKHYLGEFGITPFDEGFYLPPGREHAILVELTGSLPKAAKNVSLKRARRLNGIEDGLRIRGRLISRKGCF